MNQIFPNLYLGSIEAGWNPDVLLKQKIYNVLQIAPDIRGSMRHESPKITRMILPVDDSPETQLYPYFIFTSNWIQYHLNLKHPILIHCMAGISRSTTIVAAYAMVRYGMTRNAALKYIQLRRPIINPNHGFMEQLSKWEKFLRMKKNNNVLIHGIGI